MLPYTGVSAKEVAPDQNSTSAGNNQLLGAGKPMATTIIKRCPNGRELVIRANGSYGCAKDIVPPNEYSAMCADLADAPPAN